MKISTPVYTMSDRCLSFIREIAIFLLREKSPIDWCQSREGSKSIGDDSQESIN